VSLILGIETSCDETAAAVVAWPGSRIIETNETSELFEQKFAPNLGLVGGGGRILSNIIASQDDLHAEYRGVVPEIASRAHAERFLPVIRRAVSEARVTLKDLDAIAVGHRPGLIGSLLVGVAAAKALSWALSDDRPVPLVGVDHVHAHLYAGCLDRDLPGFPALGLVVSGGHTALYRCESPMRLQRLGATIDDAVGEAYDKVAAILGLPFPGGPSVDRLAATGGGDAGRFDFPLSRLGRDSLDFSFSGLKTAVLYAWRGVPGGRAPQHGERPPPAVQDERTRADIAASFQRAAVRVLLLKLERALAIHPDCRTLLVGGGVSANSLLRSELGGLARKHSLDLRLPPMSLCVDNAAMIAGLGKHVLDDRGWASDPLSLSAVPTTAC
jgi:N6-L-threonylcarbamoyladenine synthase